MLHHFPHVAFEFKKKNPADLISKLLAQFHLEVIYNIYYKYFYMKRVNKLLV